MDATLVTLILGALGAMSLQARALADSSGPGGRGRPMDRYQRRALTSFVVVMLAVLVLVWWAQRGPALGASGLAGQGLLDALVLVGLAMAFAGLRGVAGASAAATTSTGLGLACTGLMAFGFRLVFAAEDTEAHALLLDLCAAWGISPVGVGLLALVLYALAPLFLAMAFVAGDPLRRRNDDRRDEPYQGVYHATLVLALFTAATAWRVVSA